MLRRLILQSLRFLDFVANSDDMREGLFEALEASTGRTKSEVVLLLPELLDDADQAVSEGA